MEGSDTFVFVLNNFEHCFSAFPTLVHTCIRNVTECTMLYKKWTIVQKKKPQYTCNTGWDWYKVDIKWWCGEMWRFIPPPQKKNISQEQRSR